MTTTSRLILSALVLQFLFVLEGCKKSSLSNAGSQAQPSSSPISNLAGAPKLDACALLTNEEVAEAQGTSVTGTKGANNVQGGLLVSQCYFATAETNSSVSLVVTQSDPHAARPQSMADYWKETFGRVRDGDKAEKSGTEKEEREGGEEHEKTPTAERIEDLGDDAYWAGNAFAGALYVLKKDVMLRLSLGGPGEAGAKLAKSKSLAAKAISRL